MSPAALSFSLKWLGGEGMVDAAEAATNAQLKIDVGGTVLTECASSSASIREDVAIPAILVAEWLVGAWVQLLSNERRPIDFDEPDVLALDREITRRRECAILAGRTEPELERWSQSHCLRYARHGFPTPDLIIVREHQWLTLAWRASSAGRVRFISQNGSAQVDVDAAARAFAKFITMTLERLDDMKVETPRTTALERAFAALSEKRSLKEVVAARAGRSWDTLRKLFADRNVTTFQALGVPAELPALTAWSADSTVLGLLRSSNPQLTRADIKAFGAVTGEARKRAASSALVQMRSALSSESHKSTTDYGQGYERARAVRRHWSVPLSSTFLDLEARLEDLLGGKVIECELSDPSVDALCAWDPDGGAVIGVNAAAVMGSTKVGRRMAIAHELSHLLFHVHAGQPLGIASGPWAVPSLEREGNAFAAELLLPLEAAAKTLGKRTVTLDVVREIAATHDVSIETTLWQLANRVGAIPRARVRALLERATMTVARTGPPRSRAKR